MRPTAAATDDDGGAGDMKRLYTPAYTKQQRSSINTPTKRLVIPTTA